MKAGSVGNQAGYALTRGTSVQRYEIDVILGRGAFGITYKARDTVLGRDVAIKEFLPTAWAGREGSTEVIAAPEQSREFSSARNRFLEEARTLASLDRAPAIVRVLDFLEANGTAYMVMPLLSGETLEARLQREGVLTEDAVRRLLLPLLDGLEQVHAAGFLHRDIKPANIMLGVDGLPTLVDFGAARAALADNTKALTTIYTPGYAPVEQLTMGAQGPWTDIYALGATLFHSVTGGIPKSAVERVLGGGMPPFGPEQRRAYSMDLLAGIEAALRLKAEDRPQSIAAWRGDFGKWIGSDAMPANIETVVASTPTVVSVGAPLRRVPEEGARRQPNRWIAGAALALTAGCIAVGWHYFSDRKPVPAVPAPTTPVVELPRPTPEAAEAALGLSPYDVERLQVALTAMGFGVDVDGRLSSDTRAMIAAWQSARGNPATGYFDTEQHKALLREAADAVAKYDGEQKRGKGDMSK